MNSAQRELAQRLFEEAIRGGTPDPATWISTKTLDGEVIAEVKRLLAAHGAHPTHAETVASPMPTRLADPLIGQTLGEYRIQKLIGTGGMGRVYLAHGTSDPTLEVAMKVLGRSVAGDVALQRFSREAEVMKKLHHPGIAAFYGNGMYDEGDGAVPWFAMEYIAHATDLAVWADNNRLNLRARLSLVTEISDAIGHAHRIGVVHRDLKPANILITPKGDPKVIDFGVARCIGTDLGISGAQTQTGQLVGTMQYMSPEQFVGDPRKVDQRADIYSLGVILYELITGGYPHDVRTLSVSESARIVCEKDAPDVREFDPNVAPKLAEIVAKCLRRDRTQRFEDASALGLALRQWLRGDAVVELEPDVVEPAPKPLATRAIELGGHDARPLERQDIRRSSGWLVPTLSLVLVALVALVATGTVSPKMIINQWKAVASKWSDAPSVADSGDLVEPISIESEPSGARVTINGFDAGITPCHSSITWNETSVAATVIISKDGYQRVTHQVSAAPRGGRTAPLQVRVRLDPLVTPSP